MSIVRRLRLTQAQAAAIEEGCARALDAGEGGWGRCRMVDGDGRMCINGRVCCVLGISAEADMYWALSKAIGPNNRLLIEIANDRAETVGGAVGRVRRLVAEAVVVT